MNNLKCILSSSFGDFLLLTFDVEEFREWIPELEAPEGSLDDQSALSLLSDRDSCTKKFYFNIKKP